MRPAQPITECIARSRAQIVNDPKQRERLRALQRFQVQRLRHTYADCASQVRYRAALEFFVADLYGPHDHERRDRNLAKVLEQWTRLLPARALLALSRALELEQLTQVLDLAVLEQLQDVQPNFQTYPSAYRRADRFDERRRQIDLILVAGRDLDALLRIPALGTALRMARMPARVLGVIDLHRFLERGYSAFKQMKGADALLKIIEQRETGLMQRLIAGDADPFGLHAPAPAAPR